jgi:hypothetical protein
VFLNGSTVAGALPFVDDNSPANGGGFTEIDTFTDASLVTVKTLDVATSSSAGVAYYDNYAITVPEPSLALSGIVLAGMVGAARRRGVGNG